MKRQTEKEVRKAHIQLQYLAHVKSDDAEVTRTMITKQLFKQQK